MNPIKQKFSSFLLKSRAVLNDTGGDLIYIDTAAKILIAVVIGTLLLFGLYYLMKNNLLPAIAQKWDEVFEFADSLQEPMPGRG